MNQKEYNKLVANAEVDNMPIIVYFVKGLNPYTIYEYSVTYNFSSKEWYSVVSDEFVMSSVDSSSFFTTQKEALKERLYRIENFKTAMEKDLKIMDRAMGEIQIAIDKLKETDSSLDLIEWDIAFGIKNK